MKRIIKSVTAFLLVFALLSGTMAAFAADSEKQYEDYKSYVLLGDSIASGWSDIEDRETRFVRVEGSYGAYLADDLGVEYHPMACIGFRTTELRYIFEEDYEADRFLYYSIDKEDMDNIYAPAIIKEVTEADLITLNVGGNDWGSFLGWHVFEEMDKFEDTNIEFLNQARAYLEQAGLGLDTIDTVIEIASLTGSLPRLLEVLPKALEEGLKNYFENWNHVIEDIYALNPDVTLVVIGMFDTSLQSEATAGGGLEAALAAINLGQSISDIANIPMKEGAEKYGYILIEPKGIECEKQHPSARGHRQIADLILEALPDASFPYTDLDKKSSNYRAIEALCKKGIMEGVSETEFAPEANLTKAQLSFALGKIAGVENIAGTDGDVKRMDMVKAIWDTAFAESFTKGLKTIGFALKLLINGGKFDFSAHVSRGQGAAILYDYINQ
ncbi:MAG: S-layer homology domain-containing protein [Clostridia bacterium]|nr:S-layer homology domain-containing protein [Clostridia bacterium]